LDDQAPLHITLPSLHVDGIDGKRLVAFTKAMEFNSLTKRVAEACGLDAEAIDANSELAPGRGTADALKSKGREQEGHAATAPQRPHAAPPPKPQGPELVPSALVAARVRETHAKFERARYETVLKPQRLEHWIAKATELGFVAIDLQTTSFDAM